MAVLGCCGLQGPPKLNIQSAFLPHRGYHQIPKETGASCPPLCPQLLRAPSQPQGTSSVLHGVSLTPIMFPFSSPLSCSMKHTFPLVLKAKVSGVMHRVWLPEAPFPPGCHDPFPKPWLQWLPFQG